MFQSIRSPIKKQTMAKGRILNYRHHAKRSSTIALVLSMLLMLTVVLLMLLALGILSLPVGSDDDSSSIPNHLKFGRKIIKNSMYARTHASTWINLLSLSFFLPEFNLYAYHDVWFWCRVDGDVSETWEDQWTEVLSWEPRAFLYHNFLVSYFFYNLIS